MFEIIRHKQLKPSMFSSKLALNIHSEPLDLIIDQSSFGRSNLKKVFQVAADQNWTMLRGNFGPFFEPELLELRHVLRASCVNSSLS